MDANLKGLTSDEVVAARAQHGDNVLTPPPREPWWVQFRAKFEDPVIRILIIAALVSLGVGLSEGHVAPESIGILIAILLATGLAFANEFRAGQEFDVLNQTSDRAQVKVLRNGVHALIARREVTVGDIVELSQGDEIPADGLVLVSTALEVNESAFTGESLPVRKRAESSPTQGSIYAQNQLLRSTMIADGSGSMRVQKIGDATEIGQTARLATEPTGELSPLNAQLERLSKWIGVLGFAISASTFAALSVHAASIGEIAMSRAQWIASLCAGLGLLIALTPIWLPLIYNFFELTGRHKKPPAWLHAAWKTWAGLLALGLAIFAISIGLCVALGLVPLAPSGWFSARASKQFLEFFMIAVTIIVVAVPEGLAMSVTLSLAYSMRRMTSANCLVRRMDACETIGAATHICSDKTGTLTMNQMRVQEAHFGHASSLPSTWELIHEAISVNSTANLGHKATEASGPQVIGNPTEGALLLWMHERGQDHETVRRSFEMMRQWPFSTERKFMATVGRSARKGRVLAHFKGAPDILLARCTHMMSAQGPLALGEQRAQIEAALLDGQSRAMRTLGFAVRDVQEASGSGEDADLEALACGLTWLGFVSIADPVRPDVPAAIEKCRRAGIDVKIVTGDNPHTALEIARQIGLWDAAGLDGSASSTYGAPLEGAGRVMLGSEFAALSDEAAEEAAQGLKVLARARPSDKLRLVDSLQRRQAVVAVTGDGTNDAPALNYAQVGLAMGRAGTAVAREASDIIILDDSFGSIVTAVKWGRSLYLNIQKFILFQLTINVAACGIALLGPFIGVDLPLTVMQMLWVNLIMDTFAALALATEPPQESVLDKGPRAANEFIVSPAMARGIFATGGLFLLLFVALLKIPALNEFFASGRYAPGSREHKAEALTIFFSCFVLLQFWNMFNARTLGSAQSALAGLSRNPYFGAIAAAIVLGQILIVSFGGSFFRVVPLQTLTWVKIMGATSLVLWIPEARRLATRAAQSATAHPREIA